MSILSWLSKEASELSVVEHAALHVMSELANGTLTRAELTASHPLIMDGIKAGEAALVSYGVPVQTIEDQVLALVHSAIAGMSAAQTPAVAVQGAAP